MVDNETTRTVKHISNVEEEQLFVFSRPKNRSQSINLQTRYVYQSDIRHADGMTFPNHTSWSTGNKFLFRTQYN